MNGWMVVFFFFFFFFFFFLKKKERFDVRGVGSWLVGQLLGVAHAIYHHNLFASEVFSKGESTR